MIASSIGGIPVNEDPHAVRELIGYMPDFFGVYDRLTAMEYMEFYAACHGIPHRRRRAVASELLELVAPFFILIAKFALNRLELLV